MSTIDSVSILDSFPLAPLKMEFSMDHRASGDFLSNFVSFDSRSFSLI